MLTSIIATSSVTNKNKNTLVIATFDHDTYSAGITDIDNEINQLI